MSVPTRGYREVFKLGDIPVLIHWSVLAGIGFLCIVFLPDFQRALYVMLGYVAVVIVHEAGHAGAARALGLKVFAIQVSAGGGICLLQRPRRVRDAIWVHAAGVLAQAALLLAAVSVIVMQGWPRSLAGSSLCLCFTLINGLLMVTNLIPYTQPGGRHSDGGMLWRLYLHRFHGHPHPSPPAVVASTDQSPVFDAQTRLATLPGFLPPGFVHGIEIHNDRTTPMELVLSLFEKHLAMGRGDALALMLKIHNQGGILHPLADAETAQRVAALITAASKRQGHSLLCRAYSISDSNPVKSGGA